VVTMKNVVFWDVVSCRYCVHRRFEAIYRLHLQGTEIREGLVPRSRIFCPEDGGGTFLRNVSSHKTAYLTVIFSISYVELDASDVSETLV
jgi:hypothetical protein